MTNRYAIDVIVGVIVEADTLELAKKIAINNVIISENKPSNLHFCYKLIDQ